MTTQPIICCAMATVDIAHRSRCRITSDTATSLRRLPARPQALLQVPPVPGYSHWHDHRQRSDISRARTVCEIGGNCDLRVRDYS
jgi:hypothetical protein